MGLLGSDKLVRVAIAVVLLHRDRDVEHVAMVDGVSREVAGTRLGNCRLGDELIPSRLDLAVDTDCGKRPVGVDGRLLGQKLVLMGIEGNCRLIEVLRGGRFRLRVARGLRRVARRLRLLKSRESATVGRRLRRGKDWRRDEVGEVCTALPHRLEAVRPDNGLARSRLLHESHLRARTLRLLSPRRCIIVPEPHLPVPIRLFLASALVCACLLVDQLKAVARAGELTIVVQLDDVVEIGSVGLPIPPPEEGMLEADLDALVIALAVPPLTVDHLDRVLAGDQLAQAELAKDREHHLGGDVVVDIADVEHERDVSAHGAIDIPMVRPVLGGAAVFALRRAAVALSALRLRIR